MRIRGFEVISEFSDKNIKLPKRATTASAGYDFCSAMDITIKAGCVAIIPTGIKSYMNINEVLYIYIRSSLAIKKGLTLANSVGVIDADYYNNSSNEGHILIAIRNDSNTDIDIKVGDRIAQGVFMQYLCADNDCGSTESMSKRSGGIGSTGEN